MKSGIFRFFKVLLPFSVLLLGVHYAVSHYFFNLNLYYPLWVFYIFHFIATGLIYIFLLFIHQNFKEKTGFAFMGMGLLKMLAAVLFLLPALLNAKETAFENMLAFFIPYFLYLFLETYFAVRLINSK